MYTNFLQSLEFLRSGRYIKTYLTKTIFHSTLFGITRNFYALVTINQFGNKYCFYFYFALVGYYGTLPRASWYDVNYRKEINKNLMRKYLAYTILLEVTQKNETTPAVRKRRATEENTTTGVVPSTSQLTNFQFEIGTQTECPEPRNVDIPCNGPVDESVSYR